MEINVVRETPVTRPPVQSVTINFTADETLNLCKVLAIVASHVYTMEVRNFVYKFEADLREAIG